MSILLANNPSPAAEVAAASHLPVGRGGTEVTVPEGMSLDSAIEALKKQKSFDDLEKSAIAIREKFEDAFAYDAAHAFGLAMREQFGWFGGIAEEATMFTPAKYPALVNIAISPTESTSVPLGRFEVPGISGLVITGFSVGENGVFFHANIETVRKYEADVKALFERTRQLLVERSIYKGKAIRLRFRDSDGDKLQMPEPRFMDLTSIRSEELILPTELMAQVEANLFIPVERRADCAAIGVPGKRGVLLAGPYGTGKTLTANVLAKKATDHETTFVYCEQAEDFYDCARFGLKYGPAVIFCEDIDRVLDGKRNEDMDDILNIIDGIEAKQSNVLFVLTTNHADKIHQAMLRPGRLDAIVQFTAPDEISALRLVKMYARGLIRETEDLTPLAPMLAGQIPAVIREVVERAKLTALRYSEIGEGFYIPIEALLKSARSMQSQLALLAREPTVDQSDVEKLGFILGQYVSWGVRESHRYFDAAVAQVRRMTHDMTHDMAQAPAGVPTNGHSMIQR